MTVRVRCEVTGVVQGVGFRPFVFGLASRLGLGGFVRNEPRGVTLELEGDRMRIDSFLDALRNDPPPLARIEKITTDDVPVLGETGFVIQESDLTGSRTVLVSPDIATCEACLRELFDPTDRRYRYPFINCTNCGPRYTIVTDLPYDRSRTTMAPFPMCEACREEYTDPLDRRYHAEPTCCPVCGPRMLLLDGTGRDIGRDDPVGEAIRLLESGRVLAVKGLGGFHLAADAGNNDAVRTLRGRKHRDQKPFALMVPDIAAAHAIGVVSLDEERLLAGGERPIVLLKKRDGAPISPLAAPRSDGFGVMLPYTPLHHLLMKGEYAALVMTSGNISDEPIAYTNDGAQRDLGELADAFFIHDRGIHTRNDDSVMRVIGGAPRFIRRSRGYAPFPVTVPIDTEGREILAVGAELNNTVAISRGSHVFLSHHIGDLKNLAAYDSFREAIRLLEAILEVTPKAVATDLHPDYLSTRYAKESGLPLVNVQHHHAHIASVLAEHQRTDPVIGVALDGLGWGDDDTLWGGEFLVADIIGYRRAGSLEPLPQPGGDAAAKSPPRMAYAYLACALGERADDAARRYLPVLGDEERRLTARLLATGLNSPLTSSMGRLFDAVSALIGVCNRNTFHSQAPMELEAKAQEAADEDGFYPVSIREDEGGVLRVRAADMFPAVLADLDRGVPAQVLAARFHNSVARMILHMVTRIRDGCGVDTAALSGGVFANAFLTERLVGLLKDSGLEVLENFLVSAGDGGISLGQAAVAAARAEREGR
ncbi:MAG: carbamoyltransferase HypF [Deltaproteobacteria bacterium]|nr:carbamoyltransferase HypF [Candidatus Zymogenaceae bacterium]